MCTPNCIAFAASELHSSTDVKRLGDNPDLHGPMMSVVSDSLVNSAQLEILKLSWCDLEDSDVITLTAALSSLGCLRVLQLAANSISDDGALRVAQTFVNLPRLEILGLYDNWLTEAGVKGVRRAAASTPDVWLAMLDVQRPPGQKLGHPDDVVFSQQQLDELQEGLSQPQGRPLATMSRWSGRHSVKVGMPRDAKSKIKRYMLDYIIHGTVFTFYVPLLTTRVTYCLIIRIVRGSLSLMLRCVSGKYLHHTLEPINRNADKSRCRTKVQRLATARLRSSLHPYSLENPINYTMFDRAFRQAIYCLLVGQ
ncbi:hypothetical protein LSAT2_015724 [Lamellibrachia satsuma]|nr:hypothetical protein LSAT2_015724 [Lamellibrachia satsuma]